MDIGTLALKLVCDPNSFESGLVRAERQMEQWSTAGERYAGNIIKAFDTIKAHPVGAAVATLLAIKDSASSLVSTTITELRTLTAEGNAAANAQSKLVRQFGFTAMEAGGLQLQAKKLGLDTSELGSSMVAFERHLGDAAAGTGTASAAFVRLGLDAKTLAELPVSEALGQVGDALKQLPPGLERTSAAYAALTRRGAALLPVILQGSDAFKKSEAQAKRWGLTFTGSELESVRAANIAQREADAALASVRQGIANRIAVAAAPLETGMASGLLTALEKAEPILQWIRRAIDEIGANAGAFAGGWQQAWKEMQPAVDAVVRDLQTSLEDLGRAMGLSGDWRDTVRELGRLLGGTVLGDLIFIVESTALLLRYWEGVATSIRSIPGAMATIKALTGISLLEGLMDLNGPAKRPITPQASKAPAELSRTVREFQDALIAAGKEEKTVLERTLKDLSEVKHSYEQQIELLSELRRQSDLAAAGKKDFGADAMRQATQAASLLRDALDRVSSLQFTSLGKELAEMTDKLRSERATAGLTDWEKERYELSQKQESLLATQTAKAQAIQAQAEAARAEAARHQEEAARHNINAAALVGRNGLAGEIGRGVELDIAKKHQEIADAANKAAAGYEAQATAAAAAATAVRGLLDVERQRFEQEQNARDAAKIIASQVSEYDKLQKAIAHVRELKDLNEDRKNQEIGRLLFDATKGERASVNLAGAATAGSSEAISAVNRASLKQDPQAEIKSLVEQMKHTQDEQAQLFRRLANAFLAGQVFKPKGLPNA